MAWQDRAYYRESGGSGRLGFPAPTPVAIGLLGACLLFYVLQNQLPSRFTASGVLTFENHLAFSQPWRWISYQYLHGGAWHIFWNLLGIYFFVPPLERLWGGARTFAFYTIGGIVAGIAFGVICLFAGSADYLMGASGAILACVGAVALLFPEMMVFGIIPIRAVAAIFALWYVLTIVGERNLADAAHLGGLVFGFVAPYYGGSLWRNMHVRMRHMQTQKRAQQERDDEELVDRILQKVHDSGMNSLTRWEKRALKRATERQRIAEMARGRRGY